jgi:1-acyl-sn-glycerol-3-phosphate acyltransferase
LGDWYYNVVVFFGRHPFWLSSKPTILHLDRVPRDGAMLLASSHLSAYDVPLLMRHTPRKLDFVSITEMFVKPLVGWFFGNMNAFPLDRSRSDPKTVKIILERLSRGRAVAMFPEGRIRAVADSVIHGKPFRPGGARIARIANVPLVPVVVWNSIAYTRGRNWLPGARVRYGINYGDPITVRDEAEGERRLAEAYVALFEELADAMGLSTSEREGPRDAQKTA